MHNTEDLIANLPVAIRSLQFHITKEFFNGEQLLTIFCLGIEIISLISETEFNVNIFNLTS